MIPAVLTHEAPACIIGGLQIASLPRKDHERVRLSE